MQSSAVITRSNILWYCTPNRWLRQKVNRILNPQKTPYRELLGVLCVGNLDKTDRVITERHCMCPYHFKANGNGSITKNLVYVLHCFSYFELAIDWTQNLLAYELVKHNLCNLYLLWAQKQPCNSQRGKAYYQKRNSFWKTLTDLTQWKPWIIVHIPRKHLSRDTISIQT